ncbi:DNA-binding transcriptional regulator YhcF, GntR family [Nocardioides scoriae]|uniref:DNA-binding transcriptional regulator YhcF, GntR family n=1 Tax=Nocardioides scoriae TaxID=642780 RepID=A0A1H1VUM6_9ACTN|nr:GntR family transcriptional regulator [Nocardioides scoriae]SDS88160.1 DNA-binding transcriptional regulator YhcF, GntR family [Nocardioides scoriae]
MTEGPAPPGDPGGLALVVEPDDPTPPYEQLRRQLAGLVGAGVLAAGDRLPPLRQLAGDLGLAVGTVARAYRELEAEGLLVSRRGGGTRVASGVVPTPAAEREAQLDAWAAAYVQRARAQGHPDDAVADAVARALSAPRRP